MVNAIVALTTLAVVNMGVAEASWEDDGEGRVVRQLTVYESRDTASLQLLQK